MPLYEYRCRSCGQRFERIQKVSDDPVRECPDCGGTVERLLGIPALQFKGSGWYVTDYGKGRSAASSSNGNGAAAEGESSEKPTTKSDDKPTGEASAGAEKATS